jgi:hypothetical protein
MKLASVLLAAAALALAGCTIAPIYNVDKAPVTTVPGKNVSMNDVSTAIIRAGAALGWQITPDSPGKLTGRLALRSHLAVVDIEHDTRAYSIKYRDSTDLMADGTNIHRNYNGWIQNLEKGIRTQLSLL